MELNGRHTSLVWIIDDPIGFDVVVILLDGVTGGEAWRSVKAADLGEAR